MHAVKPRRYPILAATVGLWLAHTLPGVAAQPDIPSRLALSPGQSSPTANSDTNNQQLANTIAGQLRQSGQLRHYNVDIRVDGGVVDLTGQVADQMQRDEVLRIVQGVPGVDRVRDQIKIAATTVTPVTATTQFVVPEPRPLPGKDIDSIVPPPSAGPGGPPIEPTPIFRAPMGAGPMQPPPMPPYAWPTFAPYNNVSRVAYPTLHPYEAFPYIGPYYPFPKVPLGWRKVQLKWEDGHWWYGRFASAHDYWRVRFW
jgi:hypothetical protein